MQVGSGGGWLMGMREEEGRRSLEGRLGRTPGEIAALIEGQLEEVVGRRPAAESWSVTEIICHLRDVEELFRIRFHTILRIDEPILLVLGAPAAELERWGIGGAVTHPLDPNRWAEERQYQRQDAGQALSAFQRQRGETLALLSALSAPEWQRGGIHPHRGRLSLTDWVASLAAHDDNHLDQLRRALDGRA